MTPFYLTKIYENSLEEREQDQSHHSPFTIATAASSCPFPFLFTTPQDQASHTDHQLQLEPIDLLMFGGPTDPLVRDEDPQGSGKWMSSNMRIMRKMMSSDQATASKQGTTIQVLENQRQQGQDSSSSSSSTNSSIIRVCSDCNTTKTPLWRSGPRGPKSLCNACGIRQRKARRAMAAVAASGGLVVPSAGTTTKMQKKREEVDHTIPFKKRYRIANTGTDKKKIRLDDVTISLGKSSACHRVFPQDERDAAILLMALSCGLIRS